MRFPLPLSLFISRGFHFFVFFFSPLPTSPSLFLLFEDLGFNFFCLVIGSSAFPPLVADYSFFASRISSVFLGFPIIQEPFTPISLLGFVTI
ncbi:hypothetical protein N7475_008949 [Penicillium sp. IBT 31633x]|nr:hypothetical protein N7475_008949 [Penicillium sp. IBT 31633x]